MPRIWSKRSSKPLNKCSCELETLNRLAKAGEFKGKIGIPDNILLKQGPLEDDEFEIMKRHPQIGYEILKDSSPPFVQTGAIIALHHHEKFDGSGYPRGLQGNEISIEARIAMVADVFDALISERPYKEAWSIESALSYIENGRGKHFDPDCVDAFFDQKALILKLVEDNLDN